MKVVVSDSSPLNYLALLSDFDLLRQLYGTVVIPPAAYREVVERGAGYPVQEAVRGAMGAWIMLAEAPNPTTVLALLQNHRLDLGEAEAIIVVETLGGTPLLMDERQGVNKRRPRSSVSSIACAINSTRCAREDSGLRIGTTSRSSEKSASYLCRNEPPYPWLYRQPFRARKSRSWYRSWFSTSRS